MKIVVLLKFNIPLNDSNASIYVLTDTVQKLNNNIGPPGCGCFT